MNINCGSGGAQLLILFSLLCVGGFEVFVLLLHCIEASDSKSALDKGGRVDGTVNTKFPASSNTKCPSDSSIGLFSSICVGGLRFLFGCSTALHNICVPFQIIQISNEFTNLSNFLIHFSHIFPTCLTFILYCFLILFNNYRHFFFLLSPHFCHNNSNRSSFDAVKLPFRSWKSFVKESILLSSGSHFCLCYSRST